MDSGETSEVKRIKESQDGQSDNDSNAKILSSALGSRDITKGADNDNGGPTEKREEDDSHDEHAMIKIISCQRVSSQFYAEI